MFRNALIIFSLLGIGAVGCGILDQVTDPECVSDADCDDGLFCTGAATCDAGECRNGTPPCPMPDEAAECGVFCDENSGACIAHSCTTDAECNDGDSCNGLETCVECACVGGEPPDCDDGNPCTEDTCDADTGECVHAPVVCDDGLFCNGEESCDEESGDCLPGTPPCFHPNGPQCTAAAACDDLFNVCLEISICTSDSDCDDGLFCTGEETCDPECGVCKSGVPLCEPNETCDEVIDACVLCPDCCPTCRTDIDGDDITGPFDLASLLAQWGPTGFFNCLEANGDGDIGPFDLAILLAAWGPCP